MSCLVLYFLSMKHFMEDVYKDVYRKLIRNSHIWAIDFICERQIQNKTCAKKAWRSLENILPSILVILLLIGVILTFNGGGT